MRHSTLVELAREHRVHLPEALADGWPPRLRGTDERGWFRFQRLYDIARSVLRRPAGRPPAAARDRGGRGGGRVGLAGDPGRPLRLRARRFGGLTPTVELVLDAAARGRAATGVGIGVIIAANRTKHPLEARTLARLAAQYAGRGVIGFGLSNDERRGAPGRLRTPRSASRPGPACCSRRTAGELAGPDSVRACLDDLRADRIGHGVAAARRSAS